MRPIKETEEEKPKNEYIKSILDDLDTPRYNEELEKERLEMIQYIKDHLWTK